MLCNKRSPREALTPQLESSAPSPQLEKSRRNSEDPARRPPPPKIQKIKYIYIHGVSKTLNQASTFKCWLPIGEQRVIPSLQRKSLESPPRYQQETLFISQASPEKQNQQACIYREIYFKKLTHVMLEAWQVQKSDGRHWKAGDSGKSCHSSPKAFHWRILFKWIWAFCSIQAFSWLDEVYPQYGELSYSKSTDLNVDLVTKYPHGNI